MKHKVFHCHYILIGFSHLKFRMLKFGTWQVLGISERNLLSNSRPAARPTQPPLPPS